MSRLRLLTLRFQQEFEQVSDWRQKDEAPRGLATSGCGRRVDENPHNCNTVGTPSANAPTPEPEADPRRRFLARFPANRRSGLVNTLLDAVRMAGLQQPADVLTYASQKFKRQASNDSDPDRREFARAVVEAIHHPETRPEALELAGTLIEYQRLSPAARQAIKDQRSSTYRQKWLDNQPATEAQIRFLQSLGCPEAPRSKAHASELIDQYRAGRGGGA